MDMTGTGRTIPFATGLATSAEWQERNGLPFRRSIGAAGNAACLSAPALSAMFIASLDELACDDGTYNAPWPEKPGKDLQTAASAAVDILLGFILEDPGIPEGIKNPLRSAQLPILRMATRETGFFSCREHPARRMISDIIPLLNICRERNGDIFAFITFFSRGMQQLLQETTPKGIAFALLHAALSEFAKNRSVGSRVNNYRNTSLSTSAMIAVPI